MFLIILNAEIKHVKWSTLCLSEVILTRPWLPDGLEWSTACTCYSCFY